MSILCEKSKLYKEPKQIITKKHLRPQTRVRVVSTLMASVIISHLCDRFVGYIFPMIKFLLGKEINIPTNTILKLSSIILNQDLRERFETILPSNFEIMMPPWKKIIVYLSLFDHNFSATYWVYFPCIPV